MPIQAERRTAQNEALAIHNYEPLFVPGLLQTGDYAMAIMMACNRELAGGAADQMIRTRMGRQVLLNRLNSPTLDVIIDEMVIRRQVGGPGVMHGQLQHLLNMTNRPRDTVRVVPFAVGANPGLDGPFLILEFDTQPTLVHQEIGGMGGFLEEGRHVSRARLDWRVLGSMALSPEDSARLIAEAAGEMHTR